MIRPEFQSYLTESPRTANYSPSLLDSSELFRSIEQGDEDVALSLLNDEMTRRESREILTFAIFKACSTKLVGKILEQDGVDVNAKNIDGITPIYQASHRDLSSRIDLMGLLLYHGVEDSMNVLCKGITPLENAARLGNLQDVSSLLLYNANVGQRTVDFLERELKSEESELMIAKKQKAIELIKNHLCQDGSNSRRDRSLTEEYDFFNRM